VLIPPRSLCRRAALLGRGNVCGTAIFDLRVAYSRRWSPIPTS
jgi:hypothetical protein